jgi:hypothetical protein
VPVIRAQVRGEGVWGWCQSRIRPLVMGCWWTGGIHTESARSGQVRSSKQDDDDGVAVGCM